MKIFTAILATAVVFLALDMLWLGYVAQGFYRSRLGALMADQVNLPAAAAFYAIFIVGLAVFVILPALAAQSSMHALFLGALFGFVAYATYDLTNLATLRDWPADLSLVDMAWGTFLTAVSAAAGVAVAQRLFVG